MKIDDLRKIIRETKIDIISDDECDRKKEYASEWLDCVEAECENAELVVDYVSGNNGTNNGRCYK